MKNAKANIVNFIRSFCFIGVGVFLFILVQDILTPLYDKPPHLDETFRMQNFYALDKNELDVAFLGSSHMGYAVSPMEIYDKKNIVGFNFASGIQSVELSYFYLEEIFKTQKPKVVVWDVSDFFEKSANINFSYRDSAYRRALDSMQFGINKINASIDYAEKEEGFLAKQQRFNAIIFPVTQFHSRWKEVEEEDFLPVKSPHTVHVTKGYMLETRVSAGGGLSKEKVDDYALYDEQDMLHYKAYVRGKYEEINKEDIGVEPVFREELEEWLDKIKYLCDENGTELLLIKTPLRTENIAYDAAWDVLKYQRVKQLAEEKDISFLDCTYDAELNINEKEDYLDGGIHLNCRGAKKVSDYMADYLIEHYNLEPRKSEEMESDLALYKRMMEMAMLQTENNFSKYCSLLNSDKYIVCLASKGDLKPFISNENVCALKSLGLKTDVEEEAEVRNAYAGILCEGKVDYEELSDREICVTHDLPEEGTVVLCSPGNCSAEGAQIYVNGEDLAQDGDGLHVVVLDRETLTLVDSAVFNAEGKKLHDVFINEWQCLQKYVEIVRSKEKELR